MKCLLHVRQFIKCSDMLESVPFAMLLASRQDDADSGTREDAIESVRSYDSPRMDRLLKPVFARLRDLLIPAHGYVAS